MTQYLDFEQPTFSNLTSAIRALAMDAVEQAKSGHPGMPMGMAEIAEVLWNHHLRHNPLNPRWPNRDRFVLSNGHGSMLLYALLHLTGYDLPMSEIKRYRQLDSRTPGHPECGLTPGVEATTGALGQGLGNAVGMALAERLQAVEFNRPNHEIVDHYTYVFAGDGCLMEGISHEVCSLAGTWGLGKLICFYDDNGVSIDGPVDGWFTDDTRERFEAYGWRVIPEVNGHDPEVIQAAIVQAKSRRDKPVLICCKTQIGRGAPTKAGSFDCHGAALGEAEVAAARPHIGWLFPPFEIPDEIYQAWDARRRGAQLEAEWQRRFDRYAKDYPELAAEFRRRQSGQLPPEWKETVARTIATANSKAQSVATRKASQSSIEAYAKILPEMIGGSADMAVSTLTQWSGSKAVGRSGWGNFVFFGVREFGMTAICTGLALHGGLLPYSATFLMFSDYCRNALRMAALMKTRQIFIFTHDSIGLGGDGATHQPIEQLGTLRMIPNMDVWRPCDTVETVVAWAEAIERADGPTSLVLTRQDLPFARRDEVALANVRRGGYVLSEAAGGKPKALIIATGSEVHLALGAQKVLADQGIPVRVVSMPSTSVFERQEEAFRNAVLPRGVPRVAVEAGISTTWYKYVGLDGAVVSIDEFGKSGSAGELFEHFGLTGDNVARAVKAVL